MISKAISHTGKFFLSAMSMLPTNLLHALSKGAYILLYYVFKYRRKVVQENLHNAFPDKSADELKQIEKEHYRFLSALIFEVIKFDHISEKELQKRVRFKNTDLVEAYLKNGESVLFCSAHYGNYEWVCMAIAMNFSGTHHPIYKPLSNPIFDQWFLRARSRFGNQMVAMRQTLRTIQATKKEATMFTFGSDQAPSKEESKYWTNFLNQDTAVQLGIEKIAVKTNRPVFYLKINYLKKGYYEVDCVPLCLNPAETKEFEITEMHTHFLEHLIQDNPAYWLWTHKRWKHKPVSGAKLKQEKPTLQMEYSH